MRQGHQRGTRPEVGGIGEGMSTKPLFPYLDPVQPASEMGFTDDQLAWLTDIARPRCCHVTGEHDPRHFEERSFVCRDQLAEVAYRLREALGLDAGPDDRGHYLRRRVSPSEAVSRAGCSRCHPPAVAS